MTPPELFPDLFAKLPEELAYWWSERAAVLEFDGNHPRELAENLALIELLRAFPAAFLGFTALQLDGDGHPLWVLALPTTADRLCTHRAARYVDLAQVLASHFGGVALLTDFPARETEHLI